MRIAALYDIHGNLPALDAVLADVRRGAADSLVIGGDIFPGPLAVEVLDRLSTCGLPFQAIRGNGERTLLEHLDGKESTALPAAVRATIEWTANRVSEEHRRALRSWPASLQLEIPSIGRVLFVHATPRNDTEIFTERTPSEALDRVFTTIDANLVVCGHTHIQFERRLGELRIVNAGSVGMPFEAPGAYWAMLGPDVTLQRTDYDRSVAANLIRSVAYPGADVFADRHVLNPPNRTEMLENYAHQELR